MGYTAFGTSYSPRTSVEIDQRYTYTGRETTTDPTLMYYRYRMYGTGIGRFTSRDTLGYIFNIVLYNYASNIPVRYRDPHGLWPNDPNGPPPNEPGLPEGYPMAGESPEEEQQREEEEEERERKQQRQQDQAWDKTRKGDSPGATDCCGDEVFFVRTQCCLDKANSKVGVLVPNWDLAGYTTREVCAKNIFEDANDTLGTAITDAIGISTGPAGATGVALGHGGQAAAAYIWCGLMNCMPEGWENGSDR